MLLLVTSSARWKASKPETLVERMSLIHKPLKRSRTRRYRQCTGQLEIVHTRACRGGVVDLMCNCVRDRGYLACVVGIRGVTTALQAGCERLDIAAGIERR